MNFDYFGAQNAKWPPNDQKSITFIDKFHMTFHHVEKPYKPNGKRGFSKTKKRVAETIIKPVENEYFGVKIAKWQRNYQKAIRL